MPFSVKMERFRAEMARAIDNAYVACSEEKEAGQNKCNRCPWANLVSGESCAVVDLIRKYKIGVML